MTDPIPFSPEDHDYPRDMVGYGQTPPHPQWPGNAAIAVQFVINYEEGGENNILHGDAASEALSEIVGAEAWPDQRHWNMESTMNMGHGLAFALVPYVHRPQFTRHNLWVQTLKRAPVQVQAMKDAGWEIALMG